MAGDVTVTSTSSSQGRGKRLGTYLAVGDAAGDVWNYWGRRAGEDMTSGWGRDERLET